MGQTTRSIKIQLNEHKSNIRLYKTRLEQEKQHSKEEPKKKFGETTVARHFLEYKHNVSEIKWQIVEQIEVRAHTDMGLQLLRRESYWINKLGTLAPQGMNENLNLNVFL